MYAMKHAVHYIHVHAPNWVNIQLSFQSMHQYAVIFYHFVDPVNN